MIMWVRDTDLRDAFAAAKITVSPDKKLLAEAAFTAAEAAQASIAQALSPSLPSLKAQATALGEIEEGCKKAIAVIRDRLSAPLPEDDTAWVLADHLKRSMDPAIVALRDAASAENPEQTSVSDHASIISVPLHDNAGKGTELIDPDREAAHALAEVLLNVDRLRAWAATARIQQEAGRERERRSRAAEECSPARAFAFELIKSYGQITGRPASFSRQLIGPKRAEQPAGPLIRYLNFIFDKVQKRLAADAAHAGPAGGRAWKPSLNTLDAWIREYRRTRSAWR